jgi:transcriptional regulator with XRE-family HTH domain
MVRIDNELTDAAVTAELGGRLERLRLGRNLTQAQVAEAAGLGRRAVMRLEAGEPVALLTLLRVLRALGRLDALDALVPDTGPSPLELLALQGRARQRARPAPSGGGEGGPWRWGDELR